jgi:hypothetical protein
VAHQLMRQRKDAFGSHQALTPPRVLTSLTQAHGVEFNSINERFLGDRPSVRGAPAQCLAVGFARASDIDAGDLSERDKLDSVDLDLTGPDSVAAALLDLRPLPQSDRERDVSGQNVVAQLAAELHTQDASAGDAPRDPGRSVYEPYGMRTGYSQRAENDEHRQSPKFMAGGSRRRVKGRRRRSEPLASRQPRAIVLPTGRQPDGLGVPRAPWR